MEAANLPLTTVVYQLLFLVPGYLTYVIAVRRGKILGTRDRFDKLMLSLLASGTSIALLYVSYVVYRSITQAATTIPSVFDLSWIQLTVGFILHVGLTVVGGVLIGVGIDHLRDEDVEWIHPWLGLHRDIEGNPTVKVMLKNGTELTGKLVGYERVEDSQGLRLTDVGPQNSTVYVYGSGISHVYIVSGLSVAR